MKFIKPITLTICGVLYAIFAVGFMQEMAKIDVPDCQCELAWAKLLR